MREELEYLSKLKEKLESDYTNLELEVRMPIIKPNNFEKYEEIEINYYRSTIYPSVTFREYKKGIIETKETIEKIKNEKYSIVLSCEQEFTRSELKFSLVPSNKRIIKRKCININPNIYITKEKEYQLEIEFNIKTFELVPSIIDKYLTEYWPAKKPIEIPINIISNILIKNKYVISHKADGEHILIIEDENNYAILYDNGETSSNIENIINVYEGEKMDNNEILIFDCIMKNKINLIKNNYNFIERRKMIPEKYKLKEIIYSLYDVPKYKTDGYIITLIYKNLNIKSKFITTVDLRYKNGYLLLENEIESNITPINNNYEYKENNIYEFDLKLNLIRERNNKTKANYHFPYDNNPIYKILKGEGIYLLRSYHNLIKKLMLKKLKYKKLLDIGSAIGGDINKWDKFEKIYAIDPNLNLRKTNEKIIKIKNKVEEEYKNLDYDCVSIFFVPWNDEFIKIINKSKQAVMILMTKPINYKCESYECIVNNNEISLKIKDSKTALNIKEKIPIININFIKVKMPDIILSKDENILKNMYEYYMKI